MDYPASWLRLFNLHNNDIKEGKFATFNPEDVNNKKRTLGVVFKVSDEDSIKIFNLLEESVPKDLRNKLVFQPRQGYHFTIQWSPEEYLSTIDIKKVISEINQILNQFSPVIGDLYLPFFGRAGLYGMLRTNTNDELSKIRIEVHDLWERLGLPPGLNPDDYELAYISLVRYLETPDIDEVKQLQNMPIHKIQGVKLSEARIVLNDKFMTPENTQILDTYILS